MEIRILKKIGCCILVEDTFRDYESRFEKIVTCSYSIFFLKIIEQIFEIKIDKCMMFGNEQKLLGFRFQ